MKSFYIIFCLIFHVIPTGAQVKNEISTLAQELKLTPEQQSKITEIDEQYLLDMNGIKDRADTGYNPPKHIQLQHSYSLIRRFKSMEELLSKEQFQKIKETRFDIYPYKDWLALFYKKNKLPTLEEAVAKRVKEMKVTNQ